MLSMQVCFKPRPENRRLHLLLLVASALITMTITAGEMDVAYLFTKDDPLAWSYQTYRYIAIKPIINFYFFLLKGMMSGRL